MKEMINTKIKYTIAWSKMNGQIQNPIYIDGCRDPDINGIFHSLAVSYERNKNRPGQEWEGYVIEVPLCQ